MDNKSASPLNRLLSLDFTNPDTIWLTKQKILRRLIGILGILLPLLLYLVLLIDSGVRFPMESISHYYFTRASGVFIIVVSLLAIFLLIYKGCEEGDFFFSSAAGIFALCLLLFPTNNITLCCDTARKYSLTYLPTHGSFREDFHLFSAAIFLTSLAWMSFHIFTKSDKPPRQRTLQKRRRNRVYRSCALIMMLALLTIVAGRLGIIHEPYYTDHHMTFWMETVAVVFFGVSWIIKGETFIKDKPVKTK